MPNIGAVLKQEITRLSRREIRSQVQATRKATAQSRRYIAALRRQVAALEGQVAMLSKRMRDAVPAEAPPALSKVRFVAKGLKAQRARLALSASDYARLVGVSSQSVYNWEHGNATPRPQQLRAIARLRGIGKREAKRHLASLAAKRTANGSGRR